MRTAGVWGRSLLPVNHDETSDVMRRATAGGFRRWLSHGDQASIADLSLSVVFWSWILRGFALSATGTVNRITPAS